jgi:hypothetical protein
MEELTVSRVASVEGLMAQVTLSSPDI